MNPNLMELFQNKTKTSVEAAFLCHYMIFCRAIRGREFFNITPILT